MREKTGLIRMINEYLFYYHLNGHLKVSGGLTLMRTHGKVLQRP